jgi:benzoyl-CoA reductase subunit B
VKCDIGMMLNGNIGPTGTKLPRARSVAALVHRLLHLHEVVRAAARGLQVPVAMLHVPYQPEGRITPDMKQYIVDQLEKSIIPALEKVSGRKLDREDLARALALSAPAEDDLVAVWESAKHKPSPIDGYFGGVYYIGPIFSAFRGTEDAVAYYRELRSEVEARMALGLGPVGPDGRSARSAIGSWSRARPTGRVSSTSGACSAARTPSSARAPTPASAVCTTSASGTIPRSAGTLADYCLGCYTNLGLPSSRINLLEKYIKEYEADGFLINSVKSCNSFSAGQLLILRSSRSAPACPAVSSSRDLVDPRYFGKANIENRLQSYFQMLDARKARGYV